MRAWSYGVIQSTARFDSALLLTQTEVKEEINVPIEVAGRPPSGAVFSFGGSRLGSHDHSVPESGSTLTEFGIQNLH